MGTGRAKFLAVVAVTLALCLVPPTAASASKRCGRVFVPSLNESPEEERPAMHLPGSPGVEAAARGPLVDAHDVVRPLPRPPGKPRAAGIGTFGIRRPPASRPPPGWPCRGSKVGRRVAGTERAAGCAQIPGRASCGDALVRRRGAEGGGPRATARPAAATAGGASGGGARAERGARAPAGAGGGAGPRVGRPRRLRRPSTPR
jgi:hypothetical protein